MSFSTEIKKQLCAVRELSKPEKSAMLFGMFFAGKNLGGKYSVQTENPDIFAALCALCSSVFEQNHFEAKRLVKKSASLYTVSVKSTRFSASFFGDLSLKSNKIISGNDETSGAFLRGVFVCCGYVTDPKKEYHLELVLPEKERCEELLRFISEHGMNIRRTVRKNAPVLYAKTSEVIEDFLTYIGAGVHSLEIMQIKIEKDLRNRANRSVNCDSANLDKTVAASEKSCREIEFLLNTKSAESLKPELRETARLRLENPESSLSELCKMFDPPISRSGLNHRLQKLSALAEAARKNN